MVVGSRRAGAWSIVQRGSPADGAVEDGVSSSSDSDSPPGMLPSPIAAGGGASLGR